MKKIKIIKTLASVAVLTIASNSTWAAGTDADTSINNRATISYSVAGAAQSDINSSPTGNSDPLACVAALPASGATPPAATVCATTFEVDKKIDLTVTGVVTDVNVAPGQTGAGTSITYTVTNTGNSDELFTLTPTQVPTTGTDDVFDTSSCVVTTPTAATTYPIAEDATLNVTVQCDIPPADATVINGAESEVELLATAVTDATGATPYADSGATESAAVVDIVLADANANTAGNGTADEGFNTANDGSAVPGERNASHSAISSYVISTADLEVTKTSAVVWDPINLAVNPKRIPGAIIQYDISVENTGPAAATDLIINDVLDTPEVAYEDAIGGASACAGTITGGGTFNCSEPTSGTVTSDSFTLAAGDVTAQTATMTFFVEIQ